MTQEKRRHKMASMLPFYWLAMASSVAGVDIESHSALVQTVRQGEEADLFCQSSDSSPYKWCYWLHNNATEYPTTVKAPDATPWGFQWRKTATRCGIHFQSVELAHAGQWKCHLADTDAEDIKDVRAEAFMDLEVATPSHVALVSSSSPTLRWGEGVDLTCSASVPGWPEPSLRLVRDSSSGERKELASGSNISIIYMPDIAEDNSVFRCLWVQEKDGKLLYSGEEVSQPLYMVIVPATLANTQTFYVFQKEYYDEGEEDVGMVPEPLLMRVEFLAKPWPHTVSWYSDLANGTRLPLDQVEGLDFEQGGLEAVDGHHGHHLATTLTINNITHNISLVVEIENTAGSGVFYFTVELPPPPPPTAPPPPPPSTAYLDLHSLVTPEVYRDNLTAGSIAGLVGGLLFGLILLILSIVLCRPRRSRHDKQGREDSTGWLEKEYPLLVPATDSIKRNGNSSPLPMSTFGKDARTFNGTLHGDAPDSSFSPARTELELILPSPSSVSTDDLSSLGVRLKEFPDPLASWEDLEPDFKKRRSRYLDNDTLLSPASPNGTHAPAQVRLSGPTGYPVTIQSPRHLPQPSPRHSQFDVSLPSPRHQSPFNTIQKLHLHVPVERDGNI